MSREQKSELERERERERALSLRWISIQLKPPDSPRRPSAGSDRSSAAREGPLHFAPLVSRELLLIVSEPWQKWPVQNIHFHSLLACIWQGDSLCWGEKWGWTEGEKGWKQSRKELTRKMTCVRVKVYHQREASTLKIWWKHNQGFYHRWLSPKRFWFKIPICIWIALNRHFNGGKICFTHYGSTNSASISFLHNPVQPNDKNTFFSG